MANLKSLLVILFLLKFNLSNAYTDVLTYFYTVIFRQDGEDSFYLLPTIKPVKNIERGKGTRPSIHTTTALHKPVKPLVLIPSTDATSTATDSNTKGWINDGKPADRPRPLAVFYQSEKTVTIGYADRIVLIISHPRTKKIRLWSVLRQIQYGSIIYLII